MIPSAVLALATAILKIIEQQQALLLIAPVEYRERYFARLDKWESFWEKLSEPLYNLIVKEDASNV